jgi:excisionase family DNA binding protein
MNTSTDLLTVEEFATALRVKPSCIRRWIREARITVVHVGRLVRLPASEVNRIVRRGTRLAAGVPDDISKPDSRDRGTHGALS